MTEISINKHGDVRNAHNILVGKPQRKENIWEDCASMGS
jgi:hypothetical protein